MAKILKGSEYREKLNLEEKVAMEPAASLVAGLEWGGVIDRETLKASGQAKRLIEEARAEGAKLRSEARTLLDQVQEERERSKQEGYQEGYQEGLQTGLEMLVRVKELREKLFTDVEPQVVKLVFEIARKIIGREFNENDKAIMNVIRLALSDAVGEKILVRLNPHDFENVKKNEPELLQTLEMGKTVTFREQEGVQIGGCIVDTEIGCIDAQLDTQLGAIKKALGM